MDRTNILFKKMDATEIIKKSSMSEDEKEKVIDIINSFHDTLDNFWLSKIDAEKIRDKRKTNIEKLIYTAIINFCDNIFQKS